MELKFRRGTAEVPYQDPDIGLGHDLGLHWVVANWAKREQFCIWHSVFFFEGKTVNRSLAQTSLLAASLLVILASITACTGEKSATPDSAANGLANSLKPESIAAQTAGGNASCSASDLAIFKRGDAEIVDLTHESLPRGLFLGRSAELLIEKTTDAGLARILVREVTGGKKARIVCAYGVDKIAQDSFDVSLTGLVKFDTSEKPEGTNFTLRQYFFYQDRTGFGAVFSNPKSLATSATSVAPVAMDLKRQLSTPSQTGEILRWPDHTYALRYQRERDGIRARLIIHLENTSQSW